MAKIICRCEDLTEEEITDLIKRGVVTLDEIKRLSRAGMGHCQGRTCSKLIAQLISKHTGKPISEIKYPLKRPPVKPVPFGILAKNK
ncbi:MAG: (2Fe-2S)-binding protein [bacterium]|nr:(2Fe-2S)-binding protein [bacterium]